eukprot:351585-Chlamydomonas_euryale.AAC.4
MEVRLSHVRWQMLVQCVLWHALASQITADADLPIDVAPFKLLIGPYLNPGFATKYLQGGFNR